MKTANTEYQVVLREEDGGRHVVPVEDEGAANSLAAHYVKHDIDAFVEARDVSEWRRVEPERCGALIQPYVWCARTAGHDGGHSPTPDREAS